MKKTRIAFPPAFLVRRIRNKHYIRTVAMVCVLVLCCSVAGAQRLNVGFSTNAFSLYFVKNNAKDPNSTLLGFFTEKAQVKYTISAGAGPLISLDLGRFSISAEAKAYRTIPVKLEVYTLVDSLNYDFVASKLRFNSFDASTYVTYTFIRESSTRPSIEAGINYVRPTKKGFLQNITNVGFYEDILNISDNYYCALLGFGLKTTRQSFTIRYVRKISDLSGGNVFGYFTMNYCRYINFGKLRRNHIYIDRP